MAIEVRDLDAGYAGKAVVTAASFQVGDGEMLALVGRNGSGKSTLLRTLVGMLPALRGRVAVTAGGLPSGPADIMYVPQSERLIRRLSLRENFRLAGYRMSRKAFQSALDGLLAAPPWSALCGLLDRKAGLLSGGETLLGAICCGRMRGRSAAHFVLDEPSAGMDRRNLEEVRRLLLEIRSQPGQATILAEQDLWTTFMVADRVLVMRPDKDGAYTTRELGADLLAEIRKVMAAAGGPDSAVVRRMRDLVW